MDLDHHGQPSSMPELNGRPSVGVSPMGVDEIRAKLSQGPLERRLDRVAVEMTIPGTQYLGSEEISRVIDGEPIELYPSISGQPCGTLSLASQFVCPGD